MLVFQYEKVKKFCDYWVKRQSSITNRLVNNNDNSVNNNKS